MSPTRRSPGRHGCAKHQAAAEWLERLAGDRLADRAELLAHHYSQAVALAQATDQQAARPAMLKERARRFLVLAGHRAIDLDVPQAQAYYQRALELCPPGHPERPRMWRERRERPFNPAGPGRGRGLRGGDRQDSHGTATSAARGRP